eukprot:m.476922 g.476922  ORF g.476922 m.476922 type:complete len:347 (-) comp20702_c0_seq1:26-1066(-)
MNTKQTPPKKNDMKNRPDRCRLPPEAPYFGSFLFKMASDGEPRNPLLQGILPALLSPFNDDYTAINEESLKKLVEKHLESGVGGFYVCGRTGEGFTMPANLRKQMAELTVKAVAKRAPVIVLITAATLEETVELATHAETIGATGISSVAPLDKPKDMAAAMEFWTAVGDAVKLPLYIYWYAPEADQNATPQQFLNAAFQIPNFAGLKFTDTNFYKFEQLCTLSEGKINALTGPDEMMVGGLAMGSDGAIGSTYNVHPKLAVSIFKAFQSGDVKAATLRQKQMNSVIAKILSYGATPDNVIACLKTISKRVHGIPLGTVYKNPTALSQENEDELIKFVEDLEFKLE